MEPSWEALTVAARDPATLARWWATTLGWDRVVEGPDGVQVGPPASGGPCLFFLPEAARKAGQNRLHLDLRAGDAGVVEGLLARGARRADIGQGDVAWTVLHDPEGNEFCVLGPDGP